MLTIDIQLTDLGALHVDEILQAFYSYLQLIEATSMDKHREIYGIFQQIAENEFNFQSETIARDNVYKLSSAISKFVDEDFLRVKDLFSPFDEATLSKYSNHINSQSFIIVVFDPDSNVVYDKVEKYYKVEYAEKDLPASFKRLMNETETTTELKLPAKNDFICSQFEIYANQDGVEPMVRKNVLSEFN